MTPGERQVRVVAALEALLEGLDRGGIWGAVDALDDAYRPLTRGERFRLAAAVHESAQRAIVAPWAVR